MNELKVFTVEEANQLLPKLRHCIQDLRQRRDALLIQETEIDALELISEKNEKGESTVLTEKMQGYNQSVNAFYKVLDQLNQVGCHLKDLDMGLIDFYAFHQGRLVYLCWRSDEQKVSHWHDIGRGYAARQPLSCES